MKKIISLILALMMTLGVAFAFASCDDECQHVDNDNDGKCDNCGSSIGDIIDGITDEDVNNAKIAAAIAVVNGMYANSQPTSISTESTQTIAAATLKSNSKLIVGNAQGGKDVAVYTSMTQSLRTVENGSGNVVVGGVQTTYTRTEYLDGKIKTGSAEKKDAIVLGQWTDSDKSLIPAKGSIAINITADTVKDCTWNDGTLAFIVEAANTQSVFGYKLGADVDVKVHTNGAFVTGIEYSFRIAAGENGTPAGSYTYNISYGYDLEFPTISD